MLHEIIWSPGSSYLVSLHPQGIGFILMAVVTNVDHITSTSQPAGSRKGKWRPPTPLFLGHDSDIVLSLSVHILWART